MAEPAGGLSICLVTTFYPPYGFGGDGVYVRRLAEALAGAGHEVTIIHSIDAFRALSSTDRSPVDAVSGVTVHAVESGWARGAALASYLSGRPAFYARELKAVLDSKHFDVVHFHNVSLVGGPAVLRYGRGIKLYTTHEHWLVCPMHVLFRDNRAPCVEPHCLRCTMHFRRPPQLWRYSTLLERSTRHVDLFLAPSRFTIDAHRSRGFTRPMRLLPQFVPQSEVAGEAPGNTGGRPYFLFVGRLERLKGVQVLLDVFATFRDADLVVAGGGTFGEELRRRADGLDHVRFLGHVDASRLAGLYAGATALLIPSIGYETFGMVGVEAMARRTPVIVNDLGALPELVAESGGGLVYGSTAELLDAMRQLLADQELRRRLGDRGYEAWQTLWSERPHVEGYLAAVAEARELAG